MFSRTSRGLLDGLAAGLCLWVAAYQTPVGALARLGLGRAFHVHTVTRPLLAYYSAGVYEEGGDVGQAALALPPPIAATVPPSQALAFGVQAALLLADPTIWTGVEAVARSRGVDLGSASRASVSDLARLTDGLAADLGSPELGVAALFCGVDVVRFGRDRAQVSGRRLDLEALSRVLPPSQSGGLVLASRAVMMGEAFALRWPVPVDTHITSPFGPRIHPILGTTQQHTGVDLSVPAGTEVHATGGGIVRRASEDAVNGRVVIIDHGRGVTTAYCHNSELLVAAGERIEAGQVIARSGSTGRSTGPHVHYQLELGGKPVDPLRFHRADARTGSESAATD